MGEALLRMWHKEEDAGLVQYLTRRRWEGGSTTENDSRFNVNIDNIKSRRSECETLLKRKASS